MVSQGLLVPRDLVQTVEEGFSLGLSGTAGAHLLPLGDAGNKNRSQLTSNRNPRGGKSCVNIQED